MGGLYVTALLIPLTRSFFQLTLPDAGMIATALLASAVSIAAARAMRLLARRRSRSAAPVKLQPSTDRYSYTTTAHDAPPRSAAHAPRQRMPAAIELRRRLRSLAAPDPGSVTSLSGFLGNLSIATAIGIRTRVMLGQ